MLQTQTTSGGVEPQGTRRSALINFDPQAGGIKVMKIYGKLGRRIRAKERLEKDLAIKQDVLDAYKRDLNKLEKQKHLSSDDRRYYEVALNIAANISDKEIPRIKQELSTLNSRI